MPAYLDIAVTFLDPAFHGRADGGDPEWPPSPLRLFQALLAAAATRWRGDQFNDYSVPAFKWLQEQMPPLIVAPEPHTGNPIRIAVPNNDLDTIASAWAKGKEPKKQPSELKTLKTVRPTRLQGLEAVHYLWELPDPIPSEVRGFVDTLAATARSLVALGWGVDLVAGHGQTIPEEEATKILGVRWRPTVNHTGTGLRVPAIGTLEELQTRYDRFLNRLDGGGLTPVPPLTAFSVVGYRQPTDTSSRPVAAFEIWKPPGDLAELPAGKSKFRPFETGRWATAVAGMVRHAVATAARNAGWSEERISTFVHGHNVEGTDRARGEDADRRFAYLPLPSLESRGGTASHVGMIRRLLIVGPPGGETEVGWVRRSLAGRELFPEGGTEPVGMLSPISEKEAQLEKYRGSYSVWSTVTPVIRPGHDDGNAGKAERLLRTAFVNAGWPKELIDRTELEWRAVGFRPGVDLARRYSVPEGLDRFPRFHVRARFPVKVRGPLAVGAGRYRGLGVFAAEE
jgi:CRISPR-associated protein Csb2